MLRWSAILLFFGLLSGCVTVSEDETGDSFDNVQAAEARVTLGLNYMQQGQWQRARENLELAMQYAPDYYRSLIGMAYYLQNVGSDDEAEGLYKKALRYSPDNGDVLNNYGVFLCRKERYDDAQNAFSKAIKQPYYYQVAASYENAAFCELKAGNRETAIYKFEKALANEPTRPKTLLQLADIKIEDDKYNQARLHLFAFNKRYGYQPTSLLMLIQLEAKAGRQIEVDRYGELLATMYPDSEQYQRYIANDY